MNGLLEMESPIQEMMEGGEWTASPHIATLKDDDLSPLVFLSEPFAGKRDDSTDSKSKQVNLHALRGGLILGFVALLSMFVLLRHSSVFAHSMAGERPQETGATYQPEVAPIPTTSAPTSQFEPERVLAKYQAQHSVNVLRAEAADSLRPGKTDRKFIVGYYSCPDYSGNLLHDFVDGLLVAMLTNRTFLWAFEARNVNTKKACDDLLQAAPWIPSFSEFEKTFRLPTPIMVKSRKYVKHYTGHGRFVPVQDSALRANYKTLQPHEIYDLSRAEEQEFWYGDILLEQDYAFDFLSQLFGFENSTYAKDLVPRLYANGKAFLFVSILSPMTRWIALILHGNKSPTYTHSLYHRACSFEIQ